MRWLVAHIKQDEGVNELLTLPCSVSHLSELPALIQQQGELFDTSVLKKTERSIKPN